MSSLELDSYDDDESDGFDDVGDIGMPPPRLRPIYETIGRNLDEILQLEIELINETTDLEPETWVEIYGQRYREILTDDPTLPKGVVKRMLYFKN